MLPLTSISMSSPLPKVQIQTLFSPTHSSLPPPSSRPPCTPARRRSSLAIHEKEKTTIPPLTPARPRAAPVPPSTTKRPSISSPSTPAIMSRHIPPCDPILSIPFTAECGTTRISILHTPHHKHDMNGYTHTPMSTYTPQHHTPMDMRISSEASHQTHHSSANHMNVIRQPLTPLPFPHPSIFASPAQHQHQHQHDDDDENVDPNIRSFIRHVDTTSCHDEEEMEMDDTMSTPRHTSIHPISPSTPRRGSTSFTQPISPSTPRRTSLSTPHSYSSPELHGYRSPHAPSTPVSRQSLHEMNSHSKLDMESSFKIHVEPASPMVIHSAIQSPKPTLMNPISRSIDSAQSQSHPSPHLLHTDTPPTRRPMNEIVLTPDPKAFVEASEMMKKTPKDKSAKKCPPTPERIKRPNRLERSSSLFDNKILRSFYQDETHITGPIFDSEFYDHKLIGQGSFFQVFRVKSRAHDELFAIKRSLRSFRGKKDRESYLREVNILAFLGPHQHIVQFFRAWQEQLHFFVQLENCSYNLNEYVERMEEMGDPVNDTFLVSCTVQIAQALKHIHNAGLLHLDIKPENVLVTSDGILKLGDFGQSRIKQDVMDGSEGDSQYMAPELLFQSHEVKPSAAADIFSLGLLLFELATGNELPRSGQLWHELREGGGQRYLTGRVSIQLEHLILSMLSPNPDHRPKAEFILAALAGCHDEDMDIQPASREWDDVKPPSMMGRTVPIHTRKNTLSTHQEHIEIPSPMPSPAISQRSLLPSPQVQSQIPPSPFKPTRTHAQNIPFSPFQSTRTHTQMIPSSPFQPTRTHTQMIPSSPFQPTRARNAQIITSQPPPPPINTPINMDDDELLCTPTKQRISPNRHSPSDHVSMRLDFD